MSELTLEQWKERALVAEALLEELTQECEQLQVKLGQRAEEVSEDAKIADTLREIGRYIPELRPPERRERRLRCEAYVDYLAGDIIAKIYDERGKCVANVWDKRKFPTLESFVLAASANAAEYFQMTSLEQGRAARKLYGMVSAL